MCSPQEVWQNNPFGVGTSVRALNDWSMVLLLSVFSRSASPLFLVSKPKLICCPMLGAPGGLIQYSGNSFSLGAATKLGVSDS